jgi:hypothetical protein
MMFNSPSRFLKDIDRTYFEVSKPREIEPARPRFPEMPVFRSPEKKQTLVSGATTAISSDWKTGDRVMHRVFGAGAVVRVYRDEVTENDKIEIAFDQQGTKTLLLTHAKLERI